MDIAQIKKILLISLSNVGDVVLTFPVIDILRENFPQAELSVVVGPKAASLLRGNRNLKQVYIFDKHQSNLKKLGWVLNLRKQKFDMVVDLRNTAIPFFLSVKHKTSPIESSELRHMRRKHLDRLRTVFKFDAESGSRYALDITPAEQKYIDALIGSNSAGAGKFVVIAPGAANHAKRWTEEGFAQIADRLIQRGRTIIFAGDEQDRKIAERISAKLNGTSLNLCGQTNLLQLAELLRRASLAVVNDSGVMHLASYLDIPVVALFGPSDPQRYGPWGKNGIFIKKSQEISAVTVSDVMNCIERLG